MKSRNSQHQAWLLMIVIFFVECDTYYGLTRRASFNYVVNHRCIEQALGRVKEISDVSYKYSEGSRPLTLSGVQKADQVHYYYYKTGSINGCIYIRTTYENKSEISQTYGGLHIIPSQEQIDIIHPIMKKIEKSISETCGIMNIETIVIETCNGVKCE